MERVFKEHPSTRKKGVDGTLFVPRPRSAMNDSRFYIDRR